MGAVLLHLQHQGRSIGQLAPVRGQIGDAGQVREGTHPVLPADPGAFTVEAGQDLVETGRETAVGGGAGGAGGGAEADHEVAAKALARRNGRQGAGQDDGALHVAGRRVGPSEAAVGLEIRQTIRRPEIASARDVEGRVGPQRKVDIAFMGVKAVPLGLGAVAAAGVGHMGLEDQIGRHRLRPGRDLDPQNQGVAVGIGEDALFDLEGIARVGGHDPIGWRQGSAPGVGMQVLRAAGGASSLHRQAVAGHHGEAQRLDLGLMDQAVHGLGQHAIGQREPDLRHRPGRAAVAELSVDIGFIGGSGAGLGRARPGRRRTGRPGGDGFSDQPRRR